MENPSYRVYVTTHHFPEGDVGFADVEIIPPVPKALAELVCDRVVAYFDNRPREVSVPPESRGTRIIPIGFCDEGATVSTLLKFTRTPTFTGNEESFEGEKEELREVVEKVLSPSGAAI